MRTIRIYEILTEQADTRPGHTYDRFNVVAYTFEDAVKKAKTSGNLIGNERIQAIHLLAAESE